MFFTVKRFFFSAFLLFLRLSCPTFVRLTCVLLKYICTVQSLSCPTFVRLTFASWTKFVLSNIWPFRRLSCPTFVLNNVSTVQHLSCPTFVLSYVCSILRLFYLTFVLSYVFPVLRFSCPTFVLSYVCPVLRFSCTTFICPTFVAFCSRYFYYLQNVYYIICWQRNWLLISNSKFLSPNYATSLYIYCRYT